MNWEQFKAILWLRSRLTANQLARAGTFDYVLKMIIHYVMITISASSFFLAIGLGIFLLPNASPMAVLILWDALVGVLLATWTVSLLGEIQRSEFLSLEKLLTLPMSLKDAFLLNYLSSFVCLSIACFFPAAMGLAIALAVTHGPKMLILIPTVLSFILMLTSVTYQLRGWLASLMSNKRRQRTVMMVVMFGSIAMTQVPNVVIQLSQKNSRQRSQERSKQLTELQESFNRKEISSTEYHQRLEEFSAIPEQGKQPRQVSQPVYLNHLRLANQIVPVGWLPYASTTLVAGAIWPAVFCLSGMSFIGTASLWRCYQTTINEHTGKTKANARQAKSTALTRSKKTPFTGRPVLLLSEQSAAIARCNICTLVRAPEAKMMLIGPLIICSMFIMMVVSNGIPNIPATFALLVWLGGVSGLAFMCLSLMTNVFGMDRNDFRCFVLMPVERSAILLGKNASVLPFVGVIAIVIAMVLYYVAPIGVLHLIGCFCQMLIVFFMASIVGNWTSILFPMAMAAGTGSPTNFKVTSVLVQMLVTFASPIVVVPGGLFFGIEWLISHYLSVSSLPVFAFLSVVECWFAYKLYLAMLKRQGRLLQSRETRILEFMTSTAE